MTVAKYKRTVSAIVDPQKVKTRINARGEKVEYIQVYNDGDSEWDFTEDEADRVSKRSRLDDGNFILEDGQLERKHEAVAKALFDHDERGKGLTFEGIKKLQQRRTEE